MYIPQECKMKDLLKKYMFVYIYLQLCNICSISQVLQEEMKDHTVSHDWIHKSLCTVHHEDHKWRGENFQAGVSVVLSANSVWRKEGATAAPLILQAFFFWKLGTFQKIPMLPLTIGKCQFQKVTISSICMYRTWACTLLYRTSSSRVKLRKKFQMLFEQNVVSNVTRNQEIKRVKHIPT